ncbi:hypothetical protein Spla01_05698 [Streptomyces platensis]|uniref:Cysteine-rich CPCC domain-containing protein n=1 Tax=Streptomyces platensis TaxID=58346 RepID=A0ABX3XWS9_STRPT|nr:hypothetical protein BG653_03220 [Streptomyces platensis]
MDGGANKLSQIEAQRNYQDFGACDQHGREYVRPPAEDRAPWPDDRSVLCWWPSTFWLSAPGGIMTFPIEALIQRLDGDDDPYGARTRLVAIRGDATLAPGERRRGRTPAPRLPGTGDATGLWDQCVSTSSSSVPPATHDELKAQASPTSATAADSPLTMPRQSNDLHHAVPWRRTGVTSRTDVTAKAEGRSRPPLVGRVLRAS